MTDEVIWQPSVKQAEYLAAPEDEVLYGGAAGGGKASPVHPSRYEGKIVNGVPYDWEGDESTLLPESKVLTPKGWVLIGDVKPGMQVCNPDGTTSVVRGVFYPGEQPIYRVTMADGSFVDVGEDHLWAYSLAGARQRRKSPAVDLSVLPDGPEKWNAEVMQRCRIADTKDLKSLVDRENDKSASGSRANYVQLPMCRPIQFTQAPGRWPALSPYTIGALLGDGSLGAGTVRLTSADPAVLERVRNELPDDVKIGSVSSSENKVTGNVTVTQGYVGIRPYLRRDGIDNTRSWEKSIPDRLKLAPLPDRWALAQGLFDTDGYIDERGHIEYVTVSRQLAEDVQELVRSLGFRAKLNDKEPTYVFGGILRQGRRAYRLTIQGTDKASLFYLPRKRERAKPFNGNDVMLSHRVISVEPVGLQTTMCIQVAHMNHLYVTDDFIVTHNTDALVVEALGLHQNATEYSSYRGILFRRTFPELVDLIDRSQELYPQIAPGATYNQTDRFWEFPSGAKIRFGYLDKVQDRFRYQGQAVQYCAFDELTQHETDIGYEYLLSRLRGVETRLNTYMRATCNPGGFGHEWVKERFKIPDEGTETRQTIMLPATAWKPPQEWHRRFIPARITDNPYLSNTSYESQLHLLSEMDRRALLDGRWDVAEIKGSIYQDELNELYSKERVTRVQIESRLPVYTFWDLGRNDETAVWFMQHVGVEKRFVGYMSARLKTITWWAKEVRDWGEKNRVMFEAHYMPHDVEVKQLSLNNESRRQMFEAVGIRPIKVIPRVQNLQEGIGLTREFLTTCWFDQEGCREGLKALANYRRKYDEERDVFSMEPVHNWASNGADAFRQAAQGFRPYRQQKMPVYEELGS